MAAPRVAPPTFRSHNPGVGSEPLHGVEARIRSGQLREALKDLDQAAVRFKSAGDVAGLRDVLELATRIEPHLSGRGERAKLKQIAYAATQNIKFIERRTGGRTESADESTDLVLASPSSPAPLRPAEILPATPLNSLSPKGRQAIEQGLLPDERVKVAIRGTGSAAIVGTDRRAFIFKRGFTAGATFGHKLASFAYENIVGIEVHTGALTGAVVIHVPGAASVSTSYWQNSKSDPHKAYNAIPIARPYGPAQDGAAQLRAAISEFASGKRASSSHATSPEKPAIPGASDPLEALRKLGELRDAGILTAEEFEAKKADLLSRL